MVQYSADDIIYSNLFTGVHGNYLKPSIQAAGLDPDALASSDKAAMSFATDDSGERTKPKAWKDIWGSGQGIGSVKHIVSVDELVTRLRKEYAASGRKRRSPVIGITADVGGVRTQCQPPPEVCRKRPHET